MVYTPKTLFSVQLRPQQIRYGLYGSWTHMLLINLLHCSHNYTNMLSHNSQLLIIQAKPVWVNKLSVASCSSGWVWKDDLTRWSTSLWLIGTMCCICWCAKVGVFFVAVTRLALLNARLHKTALRVMQIERSNAPYGGGHLKAFFFHAWRLSCI
jgi:hypothetical protein